MNDLSQFTNEQLAAAKALADEIEPPFSVTYHFEQMLKQALLHFEQYENDVIAWQGRD